MANIHPKYQKKEESMRTMSEFLVHVLNKGQAAKTALESEGKSEEEITTSLGETFKFKEDRLKYFMTAMDVAKNSTLEKLYRVRVYKFDEGETVPENATQVDDIHFVPEENPVKPGKPAVSIKAGQKGGGGKKDRPKGPRPSPWGESPEEIAQKKEASKRAAAQKAEK